MKNFRDELLQDLLNNSGEFIEIKYLTDKYCGTETEFDPHDTEISRCRLGINRVLRELKEMKWIDLYPTNGMSTAHSVNQTIGKRQFINDMPVKVRLTTQGEIEFIKSKNEQQPTYQANFNAPFMGNFNQGTKQKIVMKQSEKLDIILRRLYEYRYDGKYYSIMEILINHQQTSPFDEVFALAKRLENDGHIKILGQHNDVLGCITTEGIEYVEEDSYSVVGSPIINNNYNISIVNSPNANLVNQSSNVSINQEFQDVDGAINNIRSYLEKSNDIHVEIAQNILECLKEIEQSIQTGNKPKFAIKSLIEISAGIASIGSWVTTLGQFAGIIPVPK